MRNLIRWAALSFLLHTLSPDTVTSDQAFGTLKALQGKWAIESNGKTLPIQMSYDLGSKGSILTEQFGKELSVFYLDSGALTMIHFCNAGNQPRLKLKTNNQPGVLEFEMFDITNLRSAQADHVQRIVYTFSGDRKFGLEIVWVGNQSQSSEKYTLTKL